MKKIINSTWYSLPMQLLLLHFKRYQIFLIFWYIIFATVGGFFLKNFGADTLFLAPEYFNKVSIFSTTIVGFSFGVFIMSWNITTFILNSNLLSFLVTTKNPFLKYCVNNAVLPFCLILFYLIKTIGYESHQELITNWEIFTLTIGFLGGLIGSFLIAFIYFFSADKTIYLKVGNKIKNANEAYSATIIDDSIIPQNDFIKVKWYFSEQFKSKKPRNVKHYDEAFLKNVLSHNHFSAVMAILLSFIFLVTIGFISDEQLFQIPAAASIIIFFSIVMAVSGAIAIYFRSWTLIIVILIYLGVNFLFQNDMIDPRNKAYGLDYSEKNVRPNYNRESIADLASQKNINNDKKYFTEILNNWKAKQKDSLPIMYLINTSGGGLRSTTFTMHVLQKLDSLMNGNLMNNTVMISGASGGMLGAAYYRELFLEKQTNSNININDKKYVENISYDLLNSLFSSFITRDIIGPVQKFSYNNYRYTKDRGYAFEQQLNINTNGILNKQLKDYEQVEQQAKIPIIFFSSVITQDARKLIIATHPARFLMKPNTDDNYISSSDADAIDFNSFFKKQKSKDLKILSALRMNATYPYVLPSVWLPSSPVIDVMDAGIRDNYGTEITLRFLNVFKDWIKENTSKVVLIQIRDREKSDWKKTKQLDYLNYITQPFAQLQENWFNLQDYYQSGQLNYVSENFKNHFQTICWQYAPTQINSGAGLSFHLSSAEKKEVYKSVGSKINKEAFEQFIKASK